MTKKYGMIRMAATLLAAVLIVPTGATLAAEPTGELAGFIQQAADLDAGMALVVNEPDGKLTAALAKGNRLSVQGCTWDAKAVQPGRSALVTAGVADRASIAWSEADGLPYADNLVNLLVAPSWGSRPIDVAELLRVLAPSPCQHP